MNVMPLRPELVPARAAPLRVAMLGLRGFPGVQGGVETHVENLSRELAALGCEVEAMVRSSYVPASVGRHVGRVRLVRLWAPRITGVEALMHTFFGVLRAGWTRPDILHLHAIGPALLAPLARLLGLRVVVTHHVRNYENEKWGPLGRALLRLGERAGMRWAHARIAVSPSLAARMRQAYGVPVRFLPNGIAPPVDLGPTGVLARFGLEAGRYLLTVARIDPQKRQLDLVQAFARAGMTGCKLALVGGADYASAYAREVAAAAARNAGVAMLGHQSGAALAELFAGARAFVLPSSHEGQPIAALEAIGHGCPLILSDIPAHREIATSASRHFPVGDIAALAALLREAGMPRLPAAERARFAQAHDWRRIAEQTLALYGEALAAARPRQPSSR